MSKCERQKHPLTLDVNSFNDIPQEMRALVLEGTGFEHLQVRQVPTPRPGSRQMLARVDAAGICTSLIKLVEQGPRPEFVYGWDLSRYPLILGDEGSVTLVEVGAELRGSYHPGERYVVQPQLTMRRSVIASGIVMEEKEFKKQQSATL